MLKTSDLYKISVKPFVLIEDGSLIETFVVIKNENDEIISELITFYVKSVSDCRRNQKELPEEITDLLKSIQDKNHNENYSFYGFSNPDASFLYISKIYIYDSYDISEIYKYIQLNIKKVLENKLNIHLDVVFIRLEKQNKKAIFNLNESINKNDYIA